jgi:hypothetical protein
LFRVNLIQGQPYIGSIIFRVYLIQGLHTSTIFRADNIQVQPFTRLTIFRGVKYLDGPRSLGIPQTSGVARTGIRAESHPAKSSPSASVTPSGQHPNLEAVEPCDRIGHFFFL